MPNIPRAIPPTTSHSLESTASSSTNDTRNSVPNPEADRTAQTNRHVSASQVLDSNITSPLIAHNSAFEVPSANGAMGQSAAPRSLSLNAAANLQHQGQDSPVMNETLSVIQEHISDMQPPRMSSAFGSSRGGDSGSEYSMHLDHRMSYINGEETDEEENSAHTEAEVSSWNALQVADYLAEAGVEEKHCLVFKEQEISGDVLLGMDQTSVFLKEFELGSVGRRLKTWQKIKALQDEVKGIVPAAATANRRVSRNVGSDPSSRVASGSGPARLSTMLDQTGQPSPRFSQQPQRAENMVSIMPSPPQPVGFSEVPRRPSAASIRDLHHSRRSSANDFASPTFRGSRLSSGAESPKLGANLAPSPHKKQPSFDRNWTMGNQSPGLGNGRPLSSAGLPVQSPNAEGEKLTGVNMTTPFEFDRGYFSGGEAEGRARNVLKKKSETHSRNSSYADEQRLRTATSNAARHSRFSSVDSMQQPNPAAQKYFGLNVGKRRTPSADTINKPPPPPKDAPAPVVTKLDGSTKSTATTPKSPMLNRVPGWLTPGMPNAIARHIGSRTNSDTASGTTAKSSLETPSVDGVASPITEESMKSPSRTASSTTSGGPSFDLKPGQVSSPSTTTTTPGSKTSRKKTKKETSAYTRGLEKKTPQEQMVDCDFSGWMKKKSTNLMTTWKPRLFILKGRRLSYYYSEDDTEEKGLIDISFHRVLPAGDERLTGIHATLTGAANTPTSPENAHTPTIAATEVANEPQSTLSKDGPDQMFIFKLVPPRAGQSRAINFTKPTVHYFAVPNLATGRLWMAALMKATIDRDDTKAITTTYQQKTISLAKARAMRHRPPALMNLDENVEEEVPKTPAPDLSGLNIKGIIYDHEGQEHDSGISGVDKGDAVGVSDGTANATTN